MKYFKLKSSFFLFVFLFCLDLSTVAQVGKPNPSVKHQKSEIYAVIGNFQEAILKKDSTLFNTVFFDKNTPVIGVMSDKTEMSIKLKNPNFQGLTVSNSQHFIREICRNSNQQHEIFTGIKIKIEERIATVRFDYAFVINDKIHQWGQEIWSLTFAEGQWLITGINFTIRYPEVEKPTKNLLKVLYARKKTNR